MVQRRQEPVVEIHRITIRDYDKECLKRKDTRKSRQSVVQRIEHSAFSRGHWFESNQIDKSTLMIYEDQFLCKDLQG